MSLTQEQVELRRNYVGASEVPAIMGLSPWVTAADVWYSKTHQVDFPTNGAMEAGSILEPSILAWAAERLGGLSPSRFLVHDNGINSSTLDALTNSGEPVEAKTTGIVGRGKPDEWGEEGSDEVPNYVLIQVHAQLAVTGARRAFVPALIGGRGFVMFEVQKNHELERLILSASVQFWGLVKTRQQPENSTPSIETLKALRREPGKSVEVTDGLVLSWLEACEERKHWEAREKEAKAKLIAALGDAEAGCYAGGMVTYMPQTKKEHVVKESTYRVLRHKQVAITNANGEPIHVGTIDG